MRYLPGIDNISSVNNILAGKKIGLVTNHTGVDSNLNSTIDIINEKYNLVKLFAPEHGIRGELQANVKVSTYIDEKTGIQVVSTFGEYYDDAIRQVDCMVYDIQDVGARHFSYPYLMANVMKICAKNKIPLVILDRYNPVGLNKVEGNILNDEFSGLFGGYSLATRYGMTIGELARYINSEYNVCCELYVAPCIGLRRDKDYRDYKPFWILPGPNCPTYETAICYLGSVLFEGTNVSEGRGTTKPFELIGAPWMNNQVVVDKMNKKNLLGVKFRTAYFSPTFSKYQGELCHGLQIHITDFDKFEPYSCALLLIDTIKKFNPDFKYLEANPGKKRIFDLLAGTDELRSDGFNPEKYIEEQKIRLSYFKQKSKKYYIYK